MIEQREVSRIQQEAVFVQAVAIFVERSAVRGDLWAQYDEKDALNHIKDKIARLEAGVMIGDAREQLGEGLDEDALKAALLDDAHDLINYAAFFIRHLTGEKPTDI